VPITQLAQLGDNGHESKLRENRAESHDAPKVQRSAV